MSESKTPTSEFYDVLQEIFHVFNKELFNDELPNCLITVQRKKNVMGYFSAERWVERDGDKSHEIALNPAFFSTCSFIEIFQTMVHEMCHLWQHEHGEPSRNGYHNKEWADKMEEVGLMPSHTGKPGGKRTGQRMNDYPIKHGVFEKVCLQLSESGLLVKWFDRHSEKKEDVISEAESEERSEDEADYEPNDTSAFSNADLGLPDENNEAFQALYAAPVESVPDILSPDEVKATKKPSTKTKYMCPGCNVSVWGRPNLSIKCNECGVDFHVVSK